jgi:hypothetical protein
MFLSYELYIYMNVCMYRQQDYPLTDPDSPPTASDDSSAALGGHRYRDSKCAYICMCRCIILLLSVCFATPVRVQC